MRSLLVTTAACASSHPVIVITDEAAEDVVPLDHTMASMRGGPPSPVGAIHLQPQHIIPLPSDRGAGEAHSSSHLWRGPECAQPRRTGSHTSPDCAKTRSSRGH